jgi:nitrate/TMAO reductase-like tetraheme cytochrome c subunit
MRANESVTCRNCHTESLLNPKRKRGQKQHKTAVLKGMTCIDCHYNLVHEALEPRDSFVDSAGSKAG